jgi:hypothetical protein
MSRKSRTIGAFDYAGRAFICRQDTGTAPPVMTRAARR